MNRSTTLRALTLSTCIAAVAFFTVSIPAQTTENGVALQRGYRTGYSDGYMAGYRDTIDSVARNYTRHSEYTKADRAYNKDYGTIEDYRDGYRQGFESGYDTGFDRKAFEQTLPAGLKKRNGIPPGELVAEQKPQQVEPQKIEVQQGEQVKVETVQTQPANGEQYSENGDTTTTTAAQTTAPAYQTEPTATIIIPRDTELIVELDSDLSTEKSREGEKFTARIVSPSEINGAIVEGRVSKVKRPGRIKARSELLLSFDRIILPDTARWSNMSATLTEVMPVKGDNVSKVDNEGTAVGKSSLKGDAIKVGGATGAGLVVGAIAGGPVGAAIGAGVGAAFGVGAIVIDRGKHIQLTRNQQLRIKTSYETQIR